MLERIVAEKRRSLQEIDQPQKIRAWEGELVNLPPARDFKLALVQRPEISLIAEIKRASPSAGVLREDLDVMQMAKLYEDAGAGAISVLTEEKFFRGCTDDLKQAKKVTQVPVLRKDFLLTEYQIWESRIIGSDCILLIASIVEQDELRNFLRLADQLSLQTLVEVHSPEEVEKALGAGARLIGINNRNLSTFQVDLRTTEKLVGLIPNQIVKVSESGIFTRADVLDLQNLGINAVLVGEAIIKSSDPSLKISELLGRKVEVSAKR